MNDNKEKKKKVTQLDVANSCNLDQGSISRILDINTRKYYNQETVGKVFQAARELGYVHPALVSSNRRDAPRVPVKTSVKIQVLTLDLQILDHGEAIVSEMSSIGLLLTSFNLNKNNIPLTFFLFKVIFDKDKFNNFEITCIPTRITIEKKHFGIAAKYQSATKELKKTTKEIIKQISI